ncbi:unannotated protein [freshwater metagenome]|uniref:Unannotated protein n=1 Tax=freshwater metagenome TaxID=449393 RepID=A0A6J7D1H0_9ZZZZ|nr:hypothetical protein [Actinomycetota bacterium]
MSTARNVAIILAVGAAFTFLPGGGDVAAIINRTLEVAFIAILVWGLTLLRRRFALDIETLDAGRRTLLYGAIGALVLALAGSSGLTATGLGTLAFVAILIAAAMAIVLVVRDMRGLS